MTINVATPDKGAVPKAFEIKLVLFAIQNRFVFFPIAIGIVLRFP
jgi:hypothetical protein